MSDGTLCGYAEYSAIAVSARKGERSWAKTRDEEGDRILEINESVLGHNMSDGYVAVSVFQPSLLPAHERYQSFQIGIEFGDFLRRHSHDTSGRVTRTDTEESSSGGEGIDGSDACGIDRSGASA